MDNEMIMNEDMVSSEASYDNDNNNDNYNNDNDNDVSFDVMPTQDATVSQEENVLHWYDDERLKRFAPHDGETEADSIKKLVSSYLALETKMTNSRRAPVVPDQYILDTTFDFQNEDGVRIRNLLSEDEIASLKDRAREIGLDNDQCQKLYSWYNANRQQMLDNERREQEEHLQDVEQIYEDNFGKQGSWERQETIDKIHSGVDLICSCCDGIDKSALEKEVQAITNSGFSELLKGLKAVGGDIRNIVEKNISEEHNKIFYGDVKMTSQNTDTVAISERIKKIICTPGYRVNRELQAEVARLKREANL